MDGLQVLGDVFPPDAIPPGGAHGEAPLLIDQLHRAAVHLGLGHVVELLGGAQKAFQPFVKLPGFSLAEGVLQREHGLAVAHRLEFVQGRGPHPLGGGIRGGQAVFLLQALQLGKQPVVLRVRDHRVIQDVITVIVVMELVPELFDPGDHFRGGGGRRDHVLIRD